MTLKEEMVLDLIEIETELGNPTFTWQGQDYLCTASVNEFERALETGGFALERLLTMTVRLLDDAGNDTFSGDLPQPQQTVIYNNDSYRIYMTRKHPTLAFLRIMARSVTQGL